MIATRVIQSPGNIPNVTPVGDINLTSGLTVGAGEVLYSTSASFSFIRISPNFNPSLSNEFINYGQIWNVSSDSQFVVYTNNITNFENHGLIVAAYVSPSGGPTNAIVSQRGSILNTGDIYTISNEFALGIQSYVGGANIGGSITNTGNIFVESAEGYRAVGVYENNSVNFNNSGLLQVVGGTEATGVQSGGSDGFVDNSGTIDVVATDTDGFSVGISLWNGGSLQNSGTILADIAIIGSRSAQGGLLTVDNSGTIEGSIIATLLSDVVTNSGTIIGDLFLDAGNDIYTSNTGLHQGTVYGGFGDDQIMFSSGNDIGHGGAGDDVILGGLGDDLLLGGKGNDYLDGGAGNDGLSGGFGQDTFVLQGGDRAYGYTQDDVFIIKDRQFSLIDGGSGNDTIKFENSGLFLNISAFLSDEKISSIESVETISGSGVALSESDVLSLNQDGEIFVNGDGDLALYGGSWVDQGQVFLDGDAYQLFASNTALVYVSSDTTTVISAGIPAGYNGPEAFAGLQSPDIPDIQTIFDVTDVFGFSVYDSYTIYEEETYSATRGADDSQSAIPIVISTGTVFAANVPEINLTNFGSVFAISTDSIRSIAVMVEGFDNSVENHGTIRATSEDWSQGILGQHYSVENSGVIEAISTNSGAWGVYGSQELSIVNSGTISAESGSTGPSDFQDVGTGVYARSELNLTNTGEITSTAQNRSFGINIQSGGSSDQYISNAGTIESTVLDADAASIGIRINTNLSASHNGVTVIENSGTIIADIAIFTVTFGPNWFPGAIHLDNSDGDIKGDVFFGSSDDEIENSGSIMGDVQMAAGDDSFITSGNGRLFGELFLGAGNDVAQLGLGNDTIYGEAGNDVISGGAGNDFLDGGAGVDTVSYEFSTSAVAVNLSLSGSQNTLGAGVDTLSSFENITGSAFDDTLVGSSGNNRFNGQGGNDSYDGGAGIDSVIYNLESLSDYTIFENASGGFTVTANSGDEGSDTLMGIEFIIINNVSYELNDALTFTNGADEFTGSSGDDVLDAMGGDDVVFGAGGFDVITGGAGDDFIDGGDDVDIAVYTLTSLSDYIFINNGDGTFSVNATAGSEGTDILTNVELLRLGNLDYSVSSLIPRPVFTPSDDNYTGFSYGEFLSSLAGNDTLNGGGGNDVLRGGLGADSLNGGSGVDTTDYSTSTSGLRVSLMSPATNTGEAVGDTFVSIENITGSYYDDLLVGNAGSNYLVGRSGEDSLYGLGGNDLLNGGAGADSYFGGAGTDTVTYSGSQSGLRVSLTTPSGNTGDAAGDSFNSIEIITGSNFNDVLVGDSSSNTLRGLDGADVIYSFNGDDSLYGGNGNDALYGGNGNDALRGEAGNDSLRGQLGDDLLVGGAGNDLLVGAGGMDTFYGQDGADILYGGSGNDELHGGAGEDKIYGNENDDILFGENGDDLLVGGIGNDTLAGGNNDDQIYGSNGVDILYGGNGADRLYGGGQLDMLFGGAGADILRGEGGIDTLNGGTGNDLLIGGTSKDTFIFGANDGVDRIFDFTVASELIVLNGTNFSSFADIQAAMTDGAGFVTILISEGNSIRVDGVQAADLSASNFELDGSPAVKPSQQNDEGAFLDVSFAVDPALELLRDSMLASTVMSDQGFLEFMAEDGIGYEYNDMGFFA